MIKKLKFFNLQVKMAIDFYKIKEAVKKRDDFLRDHPELIGLQSEINSMLSSVGNNPYKRCLLLQQKMLDTWFKITTY